MSDDVEHLQHYLGSDVVWDYEKPGRKTRHVEGVVMAVERAPGRMTNERGVWPCFRLRIAPTDGSRPVWTCAFADEPPPAPSPCSEEPGKQGDESE